MPMTIESTTDSESQTLSALGDAGASEADTKEVEENPADNSENEELENENENEESATSEESDEEIEEDDSENSEDDEEEKEASENSEKKGKGFRKRIDKLNSRIRERESEVEYWKRKALEQENQGEQSPQKQESLQASELERPDPDNFDSWGEYQDALVDYRVQKNFEKVRQTYEAEQAQKSAKEKQQSFEASVQEFAKTVSDFEETLIAVDDIQLSKDKYDSIITSENAPQLMYELAKRPELYERIADSSISLGRFNRELGKLEASLEKKTEEKPPIKKTKAPAPIKPVNSKKAASGIDPDKLSFQDFKKWREGRL